MSPHSFYTKLANVLIGMFLSKETKTSNEVDDYSKPKKVSKFKIFGLTIYKSKTFEVELNSDITLFQECK